MYFHTTSILGRATTDVALMDAKSSENKYCRVPIAVNQKIKDKDGKEKEIAFFYDLLLFNKAAERATKMVQKGDLIFAIGKPDYDAYVTKKDKKVAKYAVTIKPDLWQLIK